MTISIDALPPGLSHKDQQRITRNLFALLKELKPAQQVLLDRIGVRFVFHQLEDESGASDYPRRTIELNADEFRRFDHQRRPKPSHNQRWALSTLKEETLHYLAEHQGFDTSRAWQAAAKQELATKNPLRTKLCKHQRQYDSAKDEVKLSPKEYARGLTLMDRLRDIAHGEWEPGEELLVDLLLARDYLKAQGTAPEEMDETMQAAFPNTYALALRFEAGLDALATTGGNLRGSLAELHRTWDAQTHTR